MTEKAGMVGLGRMGSAMSANLIQSGFTVRGFDTCGDQMKKLKEGGGTPASSPAGAAGGARFVVLSLPSSETVREVCLGAGGICEGAEEGLLVIDTTTARPEDSAEIAGALELRGIGFLDAGLSGSSK
jgi:3-hydroxyisobutyrate dehydrogenase-like beta-hydroxyacid dehydrogenase